MKHKWLCSKGCDREEGPYCQSTSKGSFISGRVGAIKEDFPTQVPFKLISERYIRATKTRKEAYINSREQFNRRPEGSLGCSVIFELRPED